MDMIIVVLLSFIFYMLWHINGYLYNIARRLGAIEDELPRTEN